MLRITYKRRHKNTLYKIMVKWFPEITPMVLLLPYHESILPYFTVLQLEGYALMRGTDEVGGCGDVEGWRRSSCRIIRTS